MQSNRLVGIYLNGNVVRPVGYESTTDTHVEVEKGECPKPPVLIPP